MKKNNGSGTPLASVQLFLTNCQVLNSRDLVTLLQPSQPLIGAKKTSDKSFSKTWYSRYLYNVYLYRASFFITGLTKLQGAWRSWSRQKAERLELSQQCEVRIRELNPDCSLAQSGCPYMLEVRSKKPTTFMTNTP